MYRLHIRLLACLLCLVTCYSCKTYVHTTDTSVAYAHLSDSYGEDEVLSAMIKPYHDEMAEEMDVVIGELEEDLNKQKPNSNLGNWFTDVLYTEANKMFFSEVDLAVQNYGGLRISTVPKGPVTVGKIYELMPFDNMLVVVEVSGTILKKFLDGIARSGGWPISHTVSFRISEDREAENITIHGNPIDMSRSYRIAIPDYVANGGDSSAYFEGITQENSGVFIRDVIIEHLLELQELKAPIIIDSSKRIHED